MKTLATALALILLVSVQGRAQEDSVKHRIFLIGDAGNLFNNTHPVV